MSKIVMIKSTKGSANEHGSETRVYEAGEELETAQEWQMTLAQSFVEQGFAMEAGGNQAVSETKETTPKKGRPRKVKS